MLFNHRDSVIVRYVLIRLGRLVFVIPIQQAHLDGLLNLNGVCVIPFFSPPDFVRKEGWGKRKNRGYTKIRRKK